MTTRQPRLLRRDHWASHPSLWKGLIEGQSLGTGVTVMFCATDEIGRGPVLHEHPYDELFIVSMGRALFTVGDTSIGAEAGEIVFGPAHVPHKFRTLGSGRLETSDIHVSDCWMQTDLPDPDSEA